jgi:hypothetical protein
MKGIQNEKAPRQRLNRQQARANPAFQVLIFRYSALAANMLGEQGHQHGNAVPELVEGPVKLGCAG